jgi:hypothetical protein
MYPRMALQLNTSPRSDGFYKKFSSGPRPGCAPRMRRQCHSVLTPFDLPNNFDVRCPWLTASQRRALNLLGVMLKAGK